MTPPLRIDHVLLERLEAPLDQVEDDLILADLSSRFGDQEHQQRTGGGPSVDEDRGEEDPEPRRSNTTMLRER